MQCEALADSSRVSRCVVIVSRCVSVLRLLVPVVASSSFPAELALCWLGRDLWRPVVSKRPRVSTWQRCRSRSRPRSCSPSSTRYPSTAHQAPFPSSRPLRHQSFSIRLVRFLQHTRPPPASPRRRPPFGQPPQLLPPASSPFPLQPPILPSPSRQPWPVPLPAAPPQRLPQCTIWPAPSRSASCRSKRRPRIRPAPPPPAPQHPHQPS